MKESSNGFPLACWFAKLNMLRMVSRSWTWIPLFDRLSPYFMAQTCSTCLSGPWLGPNRTQMYCMICMFHGFRRAKVHGVLPYVLYSSILYIYMYIHLSSSIILSACGSRSRSRPWTLPGSWSAMPASCRRWPAATPRPLRRCWVGAHGGDADAGEDIAIAWGGI